MSKELEKLKKACSDNGIDISKMIWASYLTVELGKSYKPTVDQLDDLYSGLVGGVLYNLGSGKIPEYMDEIGPPPEERNSLENWEKLRHELIFGFGGMAYPYDEWIKENTESDEWVNLVIESSRLDEEFKKDPNKWSIELREKCKPKQR